MRRLLVHPALRWLLILPLLGWPVLASRLVVWIDWGPLAALGSLVSGARVGSSQRSHYYELDFYLCSDGRVDVIDKSIVGYLPLQPVDNSAIVVASYSLRHAHPQDYGLVLTPLSVFTFNHTFAWRVPNPPMTPAQLVAAARQSVSESNEWPAYLPPESFVEPYFSLETSAYGGLPTTLNGSTRYYELDSYYLIAEVVYLSLLVWWLLTFRYARRIWPKPDGSLCPACNYPAEGLTTPTCPECGSRIPPSPLEGEGVRAAGE